MEIHDTDRITTEVMPNGVAQLIIENANIRDIGLYTCEAHNFAGRARNMVRISVRGICFFPLPDVKSLVQIESIGRRQFKCYTKD